MDNVTIDGLVEEVARLETLMAKRPETEKKLRALIRKVLKQARADTQQGIHGRLSNDPRNAYKAVRMAVYKKVLGGNINILRPRRSVGGRSSYEPPRKLREGQRGGNRMKRSPRTQQVMSYEGGDRSFILRFLNDGTNERMAGSRDHRMREARRGRLFPRNMFTINARREIHQAAEELARLIDELIEKEATPKM